MTCSAVVAMAIPFNLPSDEETEENYRRLDQLLSDLYHVLRQILLRPRNHNPDVRPVGGTHPSAEGGGGGTQPGGGADDDGSAAAMERRLLGLPDLVRGAMPPMPSCAPRDLPRSAAPSPPANSQPGHKSPPPPPPRKSRRRRRSAPPKVSCPPHSANASHKWLHVGEELRKIAYDLRVSYSKKDDVLVKPSHKSRLELKASSLFSLLVPAPWGGSVWTTVILLVGWRLLTRQR